MESESDGETVNSSCIQHHMILNTEITVPLDHSVLVPGNVSLSGI